MKREIIYDSQYRGYKIMTDKDNGLGCYKDILDKNIDMLEHATDKYTRILYMRMDLHYPQHVDCKDNTYLKDFLNSYVKDAKRKGLNPMYTFATEKSKNEKLHHHLNFCFSAKKIKSIKQPINKATELWDSRFYDDGINHGLVDNCTKNKKGISHVNGIRLIRKNKEPITEEYNDKLNNCVRISSYTAKENSKDLPKNINSFGGSKLKSN